MLTVAEYEQYKKRLADVNKQLTTLEAKQAQLVEHLRLTYGLTPDEAQQEVNRLEKEIPVKEAEFEAKYKEFNQKWETEMREV